MLKQWLTIVIGFLIPSLVMANPWPVPFSFRTPADVAFVANAVDYDGTNDTLLRGSDLTGNADSKVGTFSAWVRLDGSNASQLRITATVGNTFIVRRLSDNTFGIQLENPAGTPILTLVSSTTYTSGATWLHITSAWDLSVPVAHLFISDADDEAGGSTETDDTIDYTASDWAIGSNGGGGGQRWDGCMSEVYINTAEFLDISVEANRRKFIDASGKAVSLGSDGSLPTGTAPIVYLNGDSTNFEINQGDGGDFSVTGALDDCSTSPTD